MTVAVCTCPACTTPPQRKTSAVIKVERNPREGISSSYPPPPPFHWIPFCHVISASHSSIKPPVKQRCVTTGRDGDTPPPASGHVKLSAGESFSVSVDVNSWVRVRVLHTALSSIMTHSWATVSVKTLIRHRISPKNTPVLAKCGLEKTLFSRSANDKDA